MADQPYTLARWLVAPGQEAAFVAAWQDLAVVFLSLPMPPHWGTLLCSIEEPRLGYSFGSLAQHGDDCHHARRS